MDTCCCRGPSSRSRILIHLSSMRSSGISVNARATSTALYLRCLLSLYTGWHIARKYLDLGYKQHLHISYSISTSGVNQHESYLTEAKGAAARYTERNMVHEEQGGCTERRGIVIQYCTSNKGAGCMACAGANCSGASVDKKGLRTGCHRKARQREGGKIDSQNTHTEYRASLMW